jgi:asparagine synthase (glutamine-hydrolysing)
MIKMTEDVIWHQDEPYQSQSAFLGYNVFKLANNHGVKVLLNGQGADEYLGGYGQFAMARYANMTKNLRISAMLQDFKKMQQINYVSYSKLISGIVFHLLPSFVNRSIKKIITNSDTISKIIDNNKLGTKPSHPYDIIPVGYRTVPEISEHQTFFSSLPKYLHWEDRNSMAHSVEARVPFLDHRLVEFSYNLPDDFLRKDGVTKRVMRAALSDLLPTRIRKRKDKMGFITPEERWVKKENTAYFREKISEAIIVTNGIIKPQALSYFDNVVSGKEPFDYTYWRIILFSEWILKFNVHI